LQGLPVLESLWLNKTQVTDAGLATLRGLRSLRAISVWDAHVTPAGVAELERDWPGYIIIIRKNEQVREQ